MFLLSVHLLVGSYTPSSNIDMMDEKHVQC